MNHLIATILVLVFGPVVPAATAAPANLVINDAPKTLAELHFTDGTGKVHTLADFKGKVVLLNMWATWCAPCRKEMPTVYGLQAALGGSDFDVITLSIDHQGIGAVNKFYGEISVQHLGRYVDSANEGDQNLGVVGLSTTLLINPQGHELGRLIGPAEWDSPKMNTFLKTISPSKRRLHHDKR